MNQINNATEAYTAHELLERFYHYILLHTKEGEMAKDYLISRGINDDTIKAFQIGFSPFKSDITFELLKRKGYSYKMLVNNNILRRRNNGKLSNLLRNRIVFPIQDYKNRTVAFGGRSIDKNSKIKYMNSAESDIFKKENNLFGLHQAKEAIEEQGYAVLLEGYFDVLKSYQNGIKNVVASLGTALTTNQALLLKSITKNVVIAYDGDEAGMDNSFRSASVLDSVGCKVRIAHIAVEQDPDEFISTYGADSFVNEVIRKAKDVKLTLIDYKKQNYDLTKATERYDYAEEVLKGILKGDKNDDKQTLEKLEDVMGISFGVMQEEIVNRMG